LLVASDDPIRAIAQFANSSDETIRAGAILQLGPFEQWGNRQLDVRCAIVKRALSDPSPLVRSKAIWSATIFRDRQEEVLPALNKLLQDHSICDSDGHEIALYAKGTIANLAWWRAKLAKEQTVESKP
jgi:HEAT repeat protein